jgi:hypothetical protein
MHIVLLSPKKKDLQIFVLRPRPFFSFSLVQAFTHELFPYFSYLDLPFNVYASHSFSLTVIFVAAKASLTPI